MNIDDQQRRRRRCEAIREISKLHSVKTDPFENRDQWLTIRTDTFPLRSH